MDHQNSSGWPPQPGSNVPQTGIEQHPQLQQRNHGGYGSNQSLQQPHSMQIPGSVSLPPPSQSSFFNSQPNGTSLPSLAGLAQSPPQQTGLLTPQNTARQSPPLHHPSQVLSPPPPQSQNQGYPLPALGQTMQESPAERDRQYHDVEMHDYEDRHRQHDREGREQHIVNERQRTPPDSYAASLPLQQPVASRIPGALHGPNGLLNANQNPGGPSPLGAPIGPKNVFANGGPAHDGLARNFLQTGPSSLPQQLPALNNTNQPPQLANGGPGATQGQQPILNDALTYLDQVKVRFQDQPDVYNRFLDIMKDFKSQAIDTPGVIDRVSSLFNGHPQLIQGFNTFLPPGYKIEAGWDNDPNSIRVTTPMGTMVQNMTGMSMPLQISNRSAPTLGETSGLSPRQTHAENGYRVVESGWPVSSQQEGAVEPPFSPSRLGQSSVYVHQAMPRSTHLPPYVAREDELSAADVAIVAHQQEQRGVSQLQSAVNVAAENTSARLSTLQSSPNDGPPPTLGQAVASLNGVSLGMPTGSQSSIEKRGPVEFNHAISYVNKIKNRFASQPEIYKQFLEILQTYQRESKPIQDVYAQVTILFNAAPDLLDDFKQFLPESAAQAKAQAATARQNEEPPALSNVRSEASYISGIQNMSHTPKPDKMPPIGNFAPPSSVSKDNRKRRGGAGSQTTVGASQNVGQELGTTKDVLKGASAAKRPKLGPTKVVATELPMPSPSLVPELPHPMPPTSTGPLDEIAFFDRVKKYFNNKQTFNEFLKLCNLFSQDLIDKNTLVSKAEGFIGQNSDLMAYFRNFVQYSGLDEFIENRPAMSEHKVCLANCRALGPSYRLLPKRERFAKCSGRDEMCHQVLNDEWASHPTWASEDSGFVSHRKNIHEEALYRMEEERHDYDFNIETCLRTIQLLEPIVQQIGMMDPEDRKHYKLPRGLGGQSEAIWQRVIKKLYDRPTGCKVVDDMFVRPTKICGVLLTRLREKVEKWKQAQREWEKVWRDQTHKQFWRSLDHQGLTVKQENKRSFQPKALQADIQAKYEEQKRERHIKQISHTPNYQLEYAFTDVEIIQDCCHLLLTYLRSQYQGTDHTRVENFLKSFLPTLFGLDRDNFAARMADVFSDSPPNEEEDELTPSEETSNRGRRSANGKKNLLRGVLDPSKQSKKEARVESKESTPDVMSMDEDSGTPTDSQSEQPTRLEPSESRWMEYSLSGSARDRQNTEYNEPFTRSTFNLYANLNIYCFLRMFAILYERLANIKSHEKAVQEDIRRAMMYKPAIELKIAEKSPAEYFDDTTPKANYYRQVVKLFEDCLGHNVDSTKVEETLRRFYMPHGWQLYNFDKMVTAVAKFAAQCIVNDTKDRSNDMINLFLANRKGEKTSHQTEIEYRKQAEKLAKDSDMYRFVYYQLTQRMTIQIFKKDDQTFDTDGASEDFNWSYYVTSYVMRDWTEGVPHNICWPFLRRNIPQDMDSEEELGKEYLPLHSEDGLAIRISPNNYRLLWDIGTTDFWVHEKGVRLRGLKGMTRLSEERRSKFEEKFVKNAKWMAGMSLDDVNKMKADFSDLVRGGSGEDGGKLAVNADEDQVMSGT